MNHIVIMGRLVFEPELNDRDGKKWCRYRLAVDSGYGDNKRTDFFDCTAWDGRADFPANNFTKGQRVLVSGQMQSREYTNKEGQKETRWSIRVETQEFADSKGAAAPAPEKPKKEEWQTPSIDDGPLPWE